MARRSRVRSDSIPATASRRSPSTGWPIRSEIRIAGGRELHLGSLQALGLYAANSIFVGDYLTTRGQAQEADHKMIEEMGFEVTRCEL